ncbi:SCO3933 family regulatory protein [Streptomyces albidochromogenes]|uniref:Regulatory protein n=1 Tax=Streptomyces albidochromogenes TaxID=329524 RepID=A0ABW6FE94_9ACTN|nr:hypothetical protein [Streptomyces albidochromogenes]
MQLIPVDMTGVTVMVAQPPRPKMKDKKNGLIAVDTETGKPLMVVDVLFVANGSADVVTVAVIEDDISGELTTGTPVALTGLVARPWENDFNGQKRHGISFRAAAVTSLAA